VTPHLEGVSPLRPEITRGADILFVRELTGGIYFGGSGTSDDGEAAYSIMSYTRREVERIVRVAAEAARSRRGKLTSVDKANVLEVSRLWRTVAADVVAGDYPDLDYEVLLVDAMTMHLLARPREFDVVVTGNMFGDIITDEASMLAGSMGLLPSASIGSDAPGVYEPVHGSAPDIAGRGIANPTALILAACMMLDHVGESDAAKRIRRAVERALCDDMVRTPDLKGDATTVEFTDAVLRRLA
jgi:3-isopropylmalate dehydrogenase